MDRTATDGHTTHGDLEGPRQVVFCSMTATTAPLDRGAAFPSALTRNLVLMAVSEGPCHGYQLARTMGRWGPGSERQLYRVLRQLEQADLMHSEWDMASGGPARRIYSLTSMGEDEVAENRAEFGHLGATLEGYTARYQALCSRRPPT